MWVEVVAAALVGLSLLWLVFEPVLTAHGSRPADVLELEGLDDLEDTRSGVALAALKEIEFDRETGKLSDKDYEFLRQKYTAEALVALRSEEGSTSQEVEAEVAARVALLRAGKAVACAGCGASAGPDAKYCPACGKPLGAPGACAKCGSKVPVGGRFCGACGDRVAA